MAKERMKRRGLALIILFAALGLAKPRSFIVGGQSTGKVEKGYVTADDGARLYYEKTGRGPVVIAPGRLFVFNDFKQLGDRYTLISYDMRNRGLSDSISDGSRLTIQNDVRDLEAVRWHFHVEGFTPVGYSYLGLMVVIYAMEHPEHVERIVQIGPVPLKFGTQYPRELVADDLDSVPDQKRWPSSNN